MERSGQKSGTFCIDVLETQPHFSAKSLREHVIISWKVFEIGGGGEETRLSLCPKVEAKRQRLQSLPDTSLCATCHSMQAKTSSSA
jgi:hypothetical protein